MIVITLFLMYCIAPYVCIAQEQPYSCTKTYQTVAISGLYASKNLILASSLWDSDIIKCLKITDGTVVKTVSDPIQEYMAGSANFYTPNESSIISANSGINIVKYGIETNEVETICAQLPVITALRAHSISLNTFFTGHMDGRAGYWDAGQAKLIHAFIDPKESAPISDIQILNNNTIAVANFYGTITLWDIAQQKIIRKLPNPTKKKINAMTVPLNQDTVLYLLDANNTLMVYNVSTNSTTVITNTNQDFNTGLVSTDKLVLASGLLGGAIKTWNVSDSTRGIGIDTDETSVNCLISQGSTLYTGHDAHIKQWKPNTLATSSVQ
ncbi:MAG: WD40 repeat domain-containing protein [Candidatus Babeliales bacterium]